MFQFQTWYISSWLRQSWYHCNYFRVKFIISIHVKSKFNDSQNVSDKRSEHIPLLKFLTSKSLWWEKKAWPWNYQSLLFNPLERSKAWQSNMHFVLVFLTIILSLTPKSFGCHWLQTVLFIAPVLQLDLNIKVWKQKIL